MDQASNSNYIPASTTTLYATSRYRRPRGFIIFKQYKIWIFEICDIIHLYSLFYNLHSVQAQKVYGSGSAVSNGRLAVSRHPPCLGQRTQKRLTFLKQMATNIKNVYGYSIAYYPTPTVRQPSTPTQYLRCWYLHCTWRSRKVNQVTQLSSCVEDGMSCKYFHKDACHVFMFRIFDEFRTSRLSFYEFRSQGDISYIKIITCRDSFIPWRQCFGSTGGLKG